MKRTILRLVPLVALVALLPLAGAPSARADQPLRYVIPVNRSAVVPANSTSNPCSFPFTISETGTYYITQFVDKSGTVVRQLDLTPRMQLTATGPSGTSITGITPAPSHVVYGASSITIVYTGAEDLFRVQGGQSIRINIGRRVVTVDLSTNPPTVTTTSFTGLRFGNPSGICSLLAP